MTLEELYSKEAERIKKLSLRYARMFEVDAEDLSQEGSLAIVETYYAYGKLPKEELLKISHRIVNRKIYKYARKEFKQKEN
jgi:DNA-directed RNA polymerase specialized sigma24 family protein